MVICPHCHYVMFSHPNVCDTCGRLLEAEPDPTNDTLVVASGRLRAVPPKRRQWRSAEVGESAVVLLRVNSNVIQVTLAPDGVLLLGRFDAHSEEALRPDVDLGPFGAFEEGVSRVHAALMLDGKCLMVKDAGSVNGTFVNEQRVTSNAWRMMRDQDELRLGTLRMVVNIE